VSLPDDNKFKKIHDAKQIGHQLLAAKERQETVFIWRIVGDKKILAPVRLEVIKRSQLELVIRPKDGNEESFHQVLGSCDQVNFYLPQSSLLFQSKFKQPHADGSVTLSYPAFVAQVERRKWLRINAEPSHNLKIQFCKTVLTPKPVNQFMVKPLLDLGAGGVSFIVTRAESKFFIAGEFVKNMEILIGNVKYTVYGEILRVSEIGAKKAWKVSVRFAAADKKEQEAIAKFVFEQLRTVQNAI
jgi:hypothetical protein